MSAVVEIDSVTKTFDDLTAVDSVSLSIERGQTLGLIGPNGAGKTTLLRLISSLAKPDSGDVRVQGVSVFRQPRLVRRQLGFMPAEFGSPRNLDIGEYLDYFACMHGIPAAERKRRVRDVCELTDLIGRESVMVKGLSTGNKQRLLLAKTLLHDPDLLILDEPASGLDPRARTELRAIIRQLAAMGKTIIISSHILPDIEEISDRIGIIEAGRLVIDGDLDSLRQSSGEVQRVIRLKVHRDDQSRTVEILSQTPECLSCEDRDGFLVITSEEANGTFVLRALLQHDVHIMHFSEAAPNLEEIFMRSTVGKVT
ncbi:MAG: ABC transporter ATP-binding protein [Fuerstiella sp.]